MKIYTSTNSIYEIMMISWKSKKEKNEKWFENKKYLNIIEIEIMKFLKLNRE